MSCRVMYRIVSYRVVSRMQVTDLFGAVLVTADFNTQNLQSAVKFLVDPYRPDMVPVYSAVPVDAYVFRSPDIHELQSDV